MDFFDVIKDKNLKKDAPLAERMKPKTLEEFIGQENILGQDTLLTRVIKNDRLSSIILHGPPGVGKTSLAKVIANTTKSDFVTLNAVTSGVKDLREVFKTAEDNLGMYNRKTILFIDEIHRFNKSQQDALLPYVEKGTVILIGATTENPYYEVNNALISRSMVFKMDPLTKEDIKKIINNALKQDEILSDKTIIIDEDTIQYLANIANGDARRALNTLELAVLSSESYVNDIEVTEEVINKCLQSRNINFDKDGNNHYDTISAFIKSMRGSDPDATLHYLARMIHGGEDPKFIARRILIQASEDVGNADPMALVIANNAFEAVTKIGMPEARIILAQAAVYVATAPKSNASYTGINQALEDVKNKNIGDIPYYIRDATSTSIERKNNDQFKNKKTYKYPHSYKDNYVEQQYLPDALKDKKYYKPYGNGYEKEIIKHFEKIKNE